MSTMIQYALYLAILVVLAIPLGAYIKNVMSGEKTFLSKVLTPCENLIYKVMRVDREEQMTWKKYAVSVMIFSGIGLVFLFLLQLLQGVLPGNPQNLSGVKRDLAFNTSASFITNTNWQAYSGESTLSYLTQALGLTVQNFVSAATGIAVLFALIRGFIKVKSSGLGSFWVDLTRIVVHILLPLNLVISLLLVGGGVIQNLKSAETVSLVEPIAVSAEGEILEDAVIDLDTETVTVDGEIVSNAQIVTEQFVPMGPVASQVAIKQTGTNGGGYMGVNSAHPLENPNAFTNLIEMISILLIPALFMGLYPGLSALNIMGLHSPQSAVLSAIIYNALIIIALIPLALKGVKYREVAAGKLLSRNLLIFGLGGLAAPFIFVKLIDVLLVFTGLV